MQSLYYIITGAVVIYIVYRWLSKGPPVGRIDPSRWASEEEIRAHYRQLRINALKDPLKSPLIRNLTYGYLLEKEARVIAAYRRHNNIEGPKISRAKISEREKELFDKVERSSKRLRFFDEDRIGSMYREGGES